MQAGKHFLRIALRRVVLLMYSLMGTFLSGVNVKWSFLCIKIPPIWSDFFALAQIQVESWGE
jgi:hypothetical protein